jgi:hypothetical protein
MIRTRQTARKSTRGLPHPIHHPQEEPNQEESEQPESKYVILEDNNDDYYGYHEGGWVDTDTEEEPMELPEDHPEVSSGSNEDPAGGDGADPSATGRDEGEDGDDDSAAPDGGDDDPDDDPEPAVAASPPPPEPHYEKEIHCLDFAEGPFPTLLWRAMQRIGFPLMPHYEAYLYKNAQQEEEWLVAVVISVPDESHGSRVEYSKHIDDVTRRTLDAGTREAARRCSTISAMLTGMNFRELSFSCFHDARGGPPVRRFLPHPLGKEACSWTLRRSWSPLSARTWICWSRDPGGQEKADEDHQGERGSGSSAEGRSRVTPGVRQRRAH